MPKATIYEDAYPLLPKNEIRLTKEGLLPAPSRDSVGAKDLDEFHFGRLIPMRLDPSHQGGPGGGIEHIDHRYFDRAFSRPKSEMTLGTPR